MDSHHLQHASVSLQYFQALLVSSSSSIMTSMVYSDCVISHQSASLLTSSSPYDELLPDSHCSISLSLLLVAEPPIYFLSVIITLHSIIDVMRRCLSELFVGQNAISLISEVLTATNGCSLAGNAPYNHVSGNGVIRCQHTSLMPSISSLPIVPPSWFEGVLSLVNPALLPRPFLQFAMCAWSFLLLLPILLLVRQWL